MLAETRACALSGRPFDGEWLLVLAKIESIALLWAPRRSIAIIAAWRAANPEGTIRVGEIEERVARAVAILRGPRTRRLSRACLAPRHLRLARGARRGRLLGRLAPVAAAWRLAALLLARQPLRQALELSG